MPNEILKAKKMQLIEAKGGDNYTFTLQGVIQEEEALFISSFFDFVLNNILVVIYSMYLRMCVYFFRLSDVVFFVHAISRALRQFFPSQREKNRNKRKILSNLKNEMTNGDTCKFLLLHRIARA